VTEKKPFSINLDRLRTQAKDASSRSVEKTDRAGEELGFVSRSEEKRRGRKPSPRTGQIHAKVMPNVSEEIADEARRRGVQQGVIIEEAWELYKKQIR
jgi:hypothetical protein